MIPLTGWHAFVLLRPFVRVSYHLHLPAEIETDVQAIKSNFITIVPLQFNMTSTTGVFSLKDCGIEGLKIEL